MKLSIKKKTQTKSKKVGDYDVRVYQLTNNVRRVR